MNEAGNEAGSVTVGLPVGQLCTSLLKKRDRFGAFTPAGYRCSNLNEMLLSYRTATGDQRKNLERGMAIQARELAELSNQPQLKRNIQELTLERLREVLDYDPLTGALTWRIRLSPKCRMGEPAGQIGVGGYRKTRIDGTYHTSSHLAWFHFYGIPPMGLLDHENRDKSDDRIENLREATHSQNSQNIGCRANSSTGLKGASRFNSPRNAKKFRSTITVDGKRIHLGQFDTAQEAHEAYCKAAKELHGEFARTDGPALPKGEPR